MCYAMCSILPCLFVAYLTTLSRAHIIRRRMDDVGEQRIANNVEISSLWLIWASFPRLTYQE
jgi:hypothetical protein